MTIPRSMWVLLFLVASASPALGHLLRPLDLSHFYDQDTLYWPGGRHFNVTKEYTRGSTGDDWYAANDIETAEHGGTHLDAPYHFHPSHWRVGDIPLDRFMGKAVYLDLRAEAEKNADYQVGAEPFIEWENLNGPLPEGAIVVLDFGWTDKYKEPARFFGTKNVSDATSFHYPGLSADGATWLGDSGKVFGVGTDTASIDFGQSRDFITHRILAEYNIYNLEYLALPKSQLPPSGYQILALPMKIRNGTGAPCRVLAVP